MIYHNFHLITLNSIPYIRCLLSVEDYINSAYRLSENRRFADAAKICLAALEIDENSFKAWQCLGYCLNELGKYKDALKVLDCAVNTNDGQPRELKYSLTDQYRQFSLRKLRGKKIVYIMNRMIQIPKCMSHVILVNLYADTIK
jgi:tetratricopeptide (TPR) repeat protein